METMKYPRQELPGTGKLTNIIGFPSIKVIWIPLHIGDFLRGVPDMNATELGAYFSLLLSHYQAGEDGLPDDDKRLALMARVTPKVWKKIRPRIQKHFHLIPNAANPEDWRWVNDRCLEEIQKMSHKSAQNSSNALKRHKERSADAKH